MARPLSASDAHRGVLNGNHPGRFPVAEEADPAHAGPAGEEPGGELERLRAENEQLRALCQELEQALQEATQQADQGWEEKVHDYETLLEEKSEMIRELHQQLK